MAQKKLLATIQTIVADVLAKDYPEISNFPNVLDIEHSNKTGTTFGDIQIRGLIGAAKSKRLSPFEVAKKVSMELDQQDFVHKAVAENAGYVNISLSDSWICERVKLFVKTPDIVRELCKEDKKRVVVDYSSPNLAKELHAGHLRSTIIGDCLVRVFEFVGFEVLRQNHVGDWGTQFGMLTTYIKRNPDVPCEVLSDLEKMYVLAKKLFDADPTFANDAREAVTKIQSGDKELLKLWKKVLDISMQHCQSLYKLLDVKILPEDTRGESFYNDYLSDVVDELSQKGLIKVDDGAKIVLTPSLQKYFKSAPIFIVQKKDKGYGYAATDLAAIRYRYRVLKADRIVYVVDIRQKLHFLQLFDIARRAEFVGKDTVLEHVEFGMILGKDQKPFKSRDGTGVKLHGLLNEACEKSKELAEQKNSVRSDESKLSSEQIDQIAWKVGIGSIKYADLSKNRSRDYVLNLDQIVSFEGDTAPYIMYAYTRSLSVIRNLGIKSIDEEDIKDFTFEDPDELTSHEHLLAVELIHIPDVISRVVSTCYPHFLCSHLFKIASSYAKFYEVSDISKCTTKSKNFRIALSILTARILKLGLELIGIRTLNAM